MSRSTFRVLFYLKRNAPKKNGMIPVMCRITVNGKVSQFSSKLAVFKQHNEDYAKQVGKMKSERSYWKYCVVYNHLSEFIKQRYKMSDIALRELTPAFITDFDLFLRTEKNHCTNTVWSYMMPFRSIIYH